MTTSLGNPGNTQQIQQDISSVFACPYGSTLSFPIYRVRPATATNQLYWKVV